uniref:Uncharacterized protein n=1 Tax=Ornithorhynchus anatinus TaxID=9258 RepID=A0A6I8NF30_ORNAN
KVWGVEGQGQGQDRSGKRKGSGAGGEVRIGGKQDLRGGVGIGGKEFGRRAQDWREESIREGIWEVGSGLEKGKGGGRGRDRREGIWEEGSALEKGKDLGGGVVVEEKEFGGAGAGPGRGKDSGIGPGWGWGGVSGWERGKDLGGGVRIGGKESGGGAESGSERGKVGGEGGVRIRRGGTGGGRDQDWRGTRIWGWERGKDKGGGGGGGGGSRGGELGGGRGRDWREKRIKGEGAGLQRGARIGVRGLVGRIRRRRRRGGGGEREGEGAGPGAGAGSGSVRHPLLGQSAPWPPHTRNPCLLPPATCPLPDRPTLRAHPLRCPPPPVPTPSGALGHGCGGLHQVHQISALRLQLRLLGIYILIAVGAVMMFVGFLGCFGAIQESQCLLGTFFTCLVILFACEVAAGIWGFVNKDQVRPVPSPGTTSFIQSHLSSAYYVQSTGLSARSGQFGNGERRSPPHDVPRADLCPLPPAPIHHPQIAKDVKQFYDQALTQAVIDEDTTNAKAVVKTFHETLQCCGADLLSTLTVTLVQKSLCPDGNAKLIHFTSNCHQKIDELFSGKLYLIGIAAIVVAVIMIFEMILSMVLCCGIRNSSVY